MSAYYQTLLRLQGRGFEAGYTSEYDFSTTQRLTLLGLPLGVATGAGFNKLASLPGNYVGLAYVRALDSDAVGVEWGKGAKRQGYPWEDSLEASYPAGSRLPPRTQTFDYYVEETRLAISAKTLDTTTPSRVAAPSSVYSTLKSYINEMVRFTEDGSGRSGLVAQDIGARELQLAVPEATTLAQWNQINRAVQYGYQRGVSVKVTVLK